jgi:hypothetical protein
VCGGKEDPQVAPTTKQRASCAELPNVSRIREAAARPWPDACQLCIALSAQREMPVG